MAAQNSRNHYYIILGFFLAFALVYFYHNYNFIVSSIYESKLERYCKPGTVHLNTSKTSLSIKTPFEFPICLKPWIDVDKEKIYHLLKLRYPHSFNGRTTTSSTDIRLCKDKTVVYTGSDDPFVRFMHHFPHFSEVYFQYISLQLWTKLWFPNTNLDFIHSTTNTAGHHNNKKSTANDNNKKSSSASSSVSTTGSLYNSHIQILPEDYLNRIQPFSSSSSSSSSASLSNLRYSTEDDHSPPTSSSSTSTCMMDIQSMLLDKKLSVRFWEKFENPVYSWSKDLIKVVDIFLAYTIKGSSSSNDSSTTYSNFPKEENNNNNNNNNKAKLSDGINDEQILFQSSVTPSLCYPNLQTEVLSFRSIMNTLLSSTSSSSSSSSSIYKKDIEIIPFFNREYKSPIPNIYAQPPRHFHPFAFFIHPLDAYMLGSILTNQDPCDPKNLPTNLHQRIYGHTSHSHSNNNNNNNNKPFFDFSHQSDKKNKKHGDNNNHGDNKANVDDEELTVIILQRKGLRQLQNAEEVQGFFCDMLFNDTTTNTKDTTSSVNTRTSTTTTTSNITSTIFTNSPGNNRNNDNNSDNDNVPTATLLFPSSTHSSSTSSTATTTANTCNSVSIVSFEGLSLFQQASHMRGADIVLSVHGAGLVNMAFMMPCSIVIEVSPFMYAFSKIDRGHTFYSLSLRSDLLYYNIQITRSESTYNKFVTQDAKCIKIMNSIVKKIIPRFTKGAFFDKHYDIHVENNEINDKLNTECANNMDCRHCARSVEKLYLSIARLQQTIKQAKMDRQLCIQNHPLYIALANQKL